MSVSSEEFRTALSRFASGVTVVTSVESSGKFHGMTVASFCSVSLDPPLILVCVNRNAGSRDVISESGRFAVNVLGSEASGLSNLFASSSEDRFEGVDIDPGLGGVPLLRDAIASIECTVYREDDGGDHIIFLGKVEKMRVADGGPLVYWKSGYRELAEIV